MLIEPAWTNGSADLVWRNGTYYLHIHALEPGGLALTRIIYTRISQLTFRDGNSEA